MVRHIVMWEFAESAGGRTRDENLAAARAMLMSLPEKIPVIREFEVGILQSQEGPRVDLVLDSSFATLEDLRAYQDHEEHRRVVAFLRTVHTGKTVFDYER
jgi:CO dehydrogenase/acetyl-CoA synthase alpha subunit